VHILDDAQIGLAGDGLFQLEAGCAALERSALPVVLDEDDRVAALAPGGDQPRDVLLGSGIVAGPEGWILEAALNIDHHERTLPGHRPDPTPERAIVGRPNQAYALIGV
jgi:hypothetical protein